MMDSSPDVLGRKCYDLPQETVATVPIDRDAPDEYDDDVFETAFLPSLRPLAGVQNTYGGRQTQPTQLVNRYSSQTTAVSSPHKSVVQVAASSPTPAPSPAPVRRPGGILASAMAPAGTVFRVPHGVTQTPRRPPVIDISDDDGPSYRGGSSDSDTAQLRKHDIKTSSFGRR